MRTNARAQRRRQLREEGSPARRGAASPRWREASQIGEPEGRRRISLTRGERILDHGRRRSWGRRGKHLVRARNRILVSFALFALVACFATSSRALLVKVSINFGPTIVGPDNGTLTVVANPGDLLVITWALGSDTDIQLYRGLVFAVDTTEITRFGGSALELTGQGFDPGGNPNAPFPAENLYNAWSDGAPIGFAGNGGELWRIEYIVTSPIADAAPDISYRFDDAFQCTAFTGGPLCPGTPGSASLNVVPEPSMLVLLGLGLTGIAFSRRSRDSSR